MYFHSPLMYRHLEDFLVILKRLNIALQYQETEHLHEQPNLVAMTRCFKYMWEKEIVDVVFGVFFGFILGFKYSDFYNLACILYLIVLTSLFRQPSDISCLHLRLIEIFQNILRAVQFGSNPVGPVLSGHETFHVQLESFSVYDRKPWIGIPSRSRLYVFFSVNIRFVRPDI